MLANTRKHQGNKVRRLTRQLYLRSERTAGRIFGETIGLEMAKQIARYSVGLRKIRN
jgi:hypothetical protein